ncbi:hypothetical protein WA026_013200 [Henosepilachna vigintioctopunctata]|uniref:Secreted protein n=1 Tax=Henosepilachna vigintioctopunctata TaxID=420089 RepID=A0AAW1UI35_9CUCU
MINRTSYLCIYQILLLVCYTNFFPVIYAERVRTDDTILIHLKAMPRYPRLTHSTFIKVHTHYTHYRG